MRRMMLSSLIILLLALNCMATATVQLGGDSGKAILKQVASVNITDQTTKASQGDLWNWGKIPMNYALDKSGKPIEEASDDEDNTWLEAINSYMPLNTSEFV
jgi:hypothetical protein